MQVRFEGAFDVLKDAFGNKHMSSASRIRDHVLAELETMFDYE